MNRIPRVQYQSLMSSFEKKGYINLNHIQINNRENLAELGQIFRDVRYETFRIIYVNKNRIVGHEAVTSKIPNNTVCFTGTRDGANRAKQCFYKMKDRMRRLKADGYYMVHNHTSENESPSYSDLGMTKKFYENLPGFKAHLIVSLTGYTWLEIIDEQIFITRKQHTYNNNFAIQKQAERKGLSGLKILSRKDLVKLMQNVVGNPNYSTAVLTDTHFTPRMILDIPNKFLNMSNQQITGYLRNMGRTCGGAHAFIATTDSKVALKSFDLLTDGVLRDIAWYHEENGEAVLNKIPLITKAPYKGLYFEEKKIGKRVCERSEKYMQEIPENEIHEMITDLEATGEENKEEFLRILYKAVGKLPVEMKIPNTLKAEQKLVQGRIEVMPYKDAVLICNEEGKIDKLDPNIVFDFDCIAGNCFVVGDDYENSGFKSLTDKQIEEFREDLIKRSYKEKIKVDIEPKIGFER